MKKIFKYISQYTGLIGILFAGFLAFKLFSFDRIFQISIAVATAASYIAWGVVHHSLHDDIEVSVVLEYIIVAAMGLIMVLSLILRS